MSWKRSSVDCREFRIERVRARTFVQALLHGDERHDGAFQRGRVSGEYHPRADRSAQALAPGSAALNAALRPSNGRRQHGTSHAVAQADSIAKGVLVGGVRHGSDAARTVESP